MVLKCDKCDNIFNVGSFIYRIMIPRNNNYDATKYYSVMCPFCNNCLYVSINDEKVVKKYEENN